ncbi:hypothetical protein Pla100_61130 [Neorhodopirellula pilleata]|uniref:Uncharacterized protein n=1 Tax=Neorhodopirellula pilleata TaxID=2714738 RepID=A0A5C5ZGC1_9BACT|nr:hypothetical protein Pla100_61130 [Neorhodopirellula pilleata]
MQRKTTTTFQTSIAALLIATAGVAFLASIVRKSLENKPSAQPLIAKTLPFRSKRGFSDSFAMTPQRRHAEMERLVNTRMASFYQSLAELIANGLGEDPSFVTVTGINRTQPDGPITIDVHWRDSRAPDSLVLHPIDSDLFRVSVPSPDGSPDRPLTINLQAIEDGEPNGG